MKYFSGFSLKNEARLFDEYTLNSPSCMAGFSYGAIKAFEEAYASKKRVQRLILLSPAFFQMQKPSFIKMQLKYFKRDSDMYIKNFIANIIYPSRLHFTPFIEKGSYEELEFLLHYKWDLKRVQELKNRGTEIEIFVGDRDKIVDTHSIIGFFENVATLYILKNRGHSLQP